MGWITTMIENIYLVVFGSMFLAKHKERTIIMFVFCIIICFLHKATFEIQRMYGFRFLISIVPDMLLIFVCYKGHPVKKGFFVVIYLALLLLAQYFSMLIVGWIKITQDCNDFAQKALYFLILSIIMIFAERFRKEEKIPLQNSTWLMMLILPVSSLVVVWFFFPYAEISDVQLPLMTAVSIFVFMVNILLFFVYRQATKFAALAVQNQSIQKAKEHSESFYRALIASNEQQRNILHDYKKNLRFLNTMIALEHYKNAEQHLKILTEDINNTSSSFRTGNYLLDDLIHGIVPSNIPVNIIGTLPQELPLNSVDLCSVLGNAIENAVAACQKNNGTITIRVNQSSHHLVVFIENPCLHQLDTNNNKHGRGIPIMKNCIEQMGGEIKFAIEDGNFSVFILIPLD